MRDGVLSHERPSGFLAPRAMYRNSMLEELFTILLPLLLYSSKQPHRNCHFGTLGQVYLSAVYV